MQSTLDVTSRDVASHLVPAMRVNVKIHALCLKVVSLYVSTAGQVQVSATVYTLSIVNVTLGKCKKNLQV